MSPVTVVSVGETPNRAIDELERSRGPVTVARRCPELTGLLAACQSGLASVALVAGSTEELTATLVDRLTAVGVGVVAVAGTPAEAARLRSIGAWTLTGTVTAELLTESVLAALSARRHHTSAAFGFPAESPAATTAVHDGGRWSSAGPSLDGGGPPRGGRSTSGRSNGSPSGGHDGGDNSMGSEAPELLDGVGLETGSVAGDGPAAGAANGTAAGAGRPSARPQTSGHSTPRGGMPGAAARVRSAVAGRISLLRSGRGPDGGVRHQGSQDGPRRDGEANANAYAKARQTRRGHPAPASATGMAAADTGPAGAPTSAAAGGWTSPRTLAVWGPVGSPGRTTVAINLAAELAAQGSRVMLVDADSYGASVAASLGLLDESASFAQACRVADQGMLTAAELGRICTEVVFAGGTFSLLTGLTRSDRWPELRAAAVERVLATALTMVDTVVIDCGFCLETDEELSYDTVAPRRNAATLTALGQADTIYAVGSADAIGLPRLIRALADLPEACAGADVQVVVNKVRKRAVGGTPLKALEQAWERFGPALPISHALPWDADVTARALLEGRLLQELAPDAPLRRAIRELCCAPVQTKQKTVVLNATARPGNTG